MIYDLVIIGAGSAGYVGAIKAAQLSKNVLIIEKDKIGGTCLNKGCIPTKTLLHGAKIVHSQRHFSTLGLDGTITFDQELMNNHKNQLVQKLTDGIESLLTGNQVVIKKGHARILNEHLIELDGEQIETNYILIASGASTRRMSNTFSSDEILDFGDKKFKELVIIGGGVIGCELASLYQYLGTKVTLLEAENRILSPFDKEISQNLTMIFKRNQINVLTQVSDISVENNSVTFTHRDSQQTIQADGVIAAIGRVATEVKSQIPIEFDRRYTVNNSLQTSTPNIYAVGDCSSTIQLAHLASAQAIAAVEHMFTGEIHGDLSTVPSVVYTSPEIASVGMTQVDDDSRYKVGKYTLNGHGYTMIHQQQRSFVKLIVDKETHCLVGASLMCENAGELISLLTHFIREKLPVHKLKELVYPHPSFIEAIQEAVNSLEDEAIHIMPKKIVIR